MPSPELFDWHDLNTFSPMDLATQRTHIEAVIWHLPESAMTLRCFVVAILIL
jgi:hypothetical protein